MSRIIKALEKEKASLEKEIEKLRYLLFEACPEIEILELRRRVIEILNRDIDQQEKFRLIEPLTIKEKSLWAVVKKIKKLGVNGCEQLVHLEFELMKIKSELWRLQREWK